MTPYTYKAPDIRPGIVKVGTYDVLIRPHPGVATPPWIWDVLDIDESTGLRVVVASYCSYPNEDNCATAVSNYRAKRSVAKLIDEATARAQHDLHRYAGRASTDGSVRQVRNGRDVLRKGKPPKPAPQAPQEREVAEVTPPALDAPAAREIQRREPRRAWTADEDAVIRQYYQAETAAELLKRLPGRSKSGLYVRVMDLGITKGRGNRRPGPRPKPTEQEPRDGTNPNGQHA